MADDVELRVRGNHVVLVHSGHGTTVTSTGAEADAALVLGAELAEALDEWARVAAAVRRTANGAGDDVVSRRGRQLASRVAAVLDAPVRYRDPMTERTQVMPPPYPWPGATRPGPGDEKPRAEVEAASVGPATPWGTGLTVSGFVAVFVIVAMLALARALADETAGWVAVLVAVVVTAGLAPSLWLGRRVPIVRWIVLGVAAGATLSWIGVLLIAFS